MFGTPLGRYESVSETRYAERMERAEGGRSVGRRGDEKIEIDNY